MNTNEDYISNQIAVYKNSRTLLEFQDKLKVAPSPPTPTSTRAGRRARTGGGSTP